MASMMPCVVVAMCVCGQPQPSSQAPVQRDILFSTLFYQQYLLPLLSPLCISLSPLSLPVCILPTFFYSPMSSFPIRCSLHIPLHALYHDKTRQGTSLTGTGTGWTLDRDDIRLVCFFACLPSLAFIFIFTAAATAATIAYPPTTTSTT